MEDQDPAVLSAHQLLLERSPFFAKAIEAFSADATTRRIALPSEELASVGAFLQYLYTGEYFPRRVGDGLESVPAGARTGEESPADGEDDDTGAQLLRHARIYALAEKLGLGELKALAHAKVHRVSSTAKGEIAYARYVYARTPADDATIRRSIAAFWGQRSHVLRHEAEAEFRTLCLDFPDFGFDVLSYVLDAREKKREKESAEGRRHIRSAGQKTTKEHLSRRPSVKRVAMYNRSKQKTKTKCRGDSRLVYN